MKLPLLFILLASISGYSQVDSLPPVSLKVKPAIQIEDTGLNSSFSITQKEFDVFKSSSLQLTLDDYVQGIPGVFLLSTNNFSQDLRIAIRGFGARSAFGIRGIKILVDGIPETTPDGQGQIDNLTLGIIDKLQVLRGPASLLYGNASGGTINIQTLRKVDSTFAQLATTVGSFGLLKTDLIVGFEKSGWETIITGSRTSIDGYRDYSAFQTNQLNVRTSHKIDENSNINLQFNYTNSPQAQDAGGLTFEEVRENRGQARDRNVLFESGEQVDQLKTGVAYEHQGDHLGINSYAFYSYRDFNNKLPFEGQGQVELYRNYFGHGSYITKNQEWDGGSNKVQLGYAIAFQEDQRQRYDNLEGIRGSSNFDQLESFYTYGGYIIDDLKLNDWSIQGGLRYDINQLSVEDRTMSLNSSDRSLNSWSGSIGANYTLNRWLHFYGNVSTSFETPTLTELSSNPDGGTGFNRAISPQKAINYELGIKSQSQKLSWNLALFYIKTKDDLVPFELEQFAGRTFYRNAGSTDRRGLELWADYKLNRQLSINGSYTYSQFEYDNFTAGGNDLSGKNLPGIPVHMGMLSLIYQGKTGWYGTLNNTYRGQLYADDGNATSVSDAFITNVSLNYPLEMENIGFSLLTGINNLWDTQYFDNIRINAFGNRFYEPAPGINFYVGARVRI